jgi:hypothetical protein
LVERHVANVGVVGSNPIVRSRSSCPPARRRAILGVVRVQGLKSLGVLLLVVLPLAIANNSSARLGLPKSFTDASDTFAPAKPAAPVAPVDPVAPARPALATSAGNGISIFDETIGLQEEIGRLNEGGLDNDDLDRIKDEIREDIKDIDQDLDRIRDDLDEADDDLRAVEHDKNVRDSDELAQAKNKLASLEDAVRDLNGRRIDIKVRAQRLANERDNGRVDTEPLLADVRALGRAIDSVRAGVDVLDDLVNIVEDKAD